MAIPKFRQVIRPGANGSDVWAVKRALIKMHVKGSGSLAHTKNAGESFVKCIKTVERNHDKKVDGIYGPQVHKIIAPYFDLYGRLLYRTAAIRKPPTPPVPVGNAQSLARRLLTYHAQGKYHADNPGDMNDIRSAADGKAVWSRGGYYTHIDPKVFEVLIWLIEEGHKIGTFAICSDHSNDGPHGHAGGRAVDISSIDGVSVAAHNARNVTLQIARVLHNAPAALKPRQLICGGYGYIRDWEISDYCIPAADSFYGSETMREHCNHIHCGF